MLAQQKQQITRLFQNAVDSLTEGQNLPKNPVISLERPRDASHGDIACNIAMQLAKPLKRNPREIAQTILDSVLTAPAHKDLIESGEIAGPGFINLRLTAAAKQRVVKTVMEQKEKYGYGNRGAGKKVMVEFVSANSDRAASCRSWTTGRHWEIPYRPCLKHQGYAVTREFYYNDAGVQIENLTLSVQARAKGLKPGDADWPGECL